MMSSVASTVRSNAPELEHLAGELAGAWCRETSAQPTEWTEENPALGQCAVSALVVQDVLGGDLIQAVVNGISHYWNRLDSGEELDFTRDQFGATVRVETEPGVRSRIYVLSFPKTVARYDLLRERLGRG
jgi:hypothetical protein